MVTVHGKGTYVKGTNQELLKEEQQKEVKTDLEMAIQKGRNCGMKNDEVKQLFDLIMEDSLC